MIARLRAHEAELHRLGVPRLSLFGSVARDEAGQTSEVDLAATFDRSRPFGIFGYAAVSERLRELLGTEVDLLGEPARRPGLQAALERDRGDVF